MCRSEFAQDFLDSIASNMWIPIQVYEAETKDGRKLSSREVSKILALWMQSTFGLLTLLSLRHEIRGSWSEWVTEDVRNLPILNPSLLDSKSVDSLLILWENVKDYDWATIHDQLIAVQEDRNHKRRKIDELFCRVLFGDNNPLPDLDEFYKDLGQEIQKMGNLMK